MYPNPIKNQFHIDLNTIKESINRMAIYDNMGRLVQVLNNLETESMNAVHFDAAPGVYFIQVQTSENILTQKIIKE